MTAVASDESSDCGEGALWRNALPLRRAGRKRGRLQSARSSAYSFHCRPCPCACACTHPAGELGAAPRCWQLLSRRCDSAAVLSWAAEGTLCRLRADWPLTRCLVYSDLPGVPEPRGFLPPSFINLSLGSSSCDNSLEALLGLRPSSWIRVLTLPHLTCTHCSSSSVSRSTLALLSNVPVQQR